MLKDELQLQLQILLLRLASSESEAQTVKRRLTGQEKDTKKSLETNVTNYIFALITMAKVRILLADFNTWSCQF